MPTMAPDPRNRMYQSEQLRVAIAGDYHKQPSWLHELPEAFAAYPAADVSIESIGELPRRDPAVPPLAPPE